MPPAHLAYTTNLTHRHPVGAGHARPTTLPLHPFHLNPVGEGFIPPAYPTPSPTQRFTCTIRLSDQHPRADMESAPTVVGVGVPDDPPMQFPAAALLRADASIRPYKLWPSHSKSPTCTLPKNPPQNLSKKSKTTLDNSRTHCYNKQAVPRRRPRQALLSTACTRFLKKTSSKNFQKTP